MISWNKRNGQRATVKRPGTREYEADYANKNKQFFGKRTESGCLSCGSIEVVARGSNGRLFIYCAKCNKQLRVINTKPVKVGSWSKLGIFRTRAGLCQKCGGGSYVGKMHLDKTNKHYVLTLRCQSCGAACGWHNL